MSGENKEFFEIVTFAIDAEIIDVEYDGQAIFFDVDLPFAVAIAAGGKGAFEGLHQEMLSKIRQGVRLSLEIRISETGGSSLPSVCLGDNGESDNGEGVDS